MSYHETTSDEHCDALVSAILGSWAGIGDRQGVRMIFHADGHYEMWQLRRGVWKHQYSQRYWIGYAVHQGMLRTELHMDLPDMEDYVVRYYLDGHILHFEEPTWHEPTMRFVKEEE